MATSITHTQTRSMTATGPRVQDTVTGTTNSLPVELFVYRTEDEVFSHVARINDITAYPATRAAAITSGYEYYRLDTCDRTLPSVALATEFAGLIKTVFKRLVVDWDESVPFVGTETETISS